MKNIAVGQSGGPTAVINASLAGVLREANRSGLKVYGAKNGIEGIIHDNLTEINLSDSDLNLLQATPAAALGSCRYKLLDSVDEVYARIKEVLLKYDIGAFLYIGGNDSMETVVKLSKHLGDTGIKFIGVPKTIDNDLECTDHCPGFGSAARYLAVTLQEIILDCAVYYTNSVTIIEIMGRDTGWLTASVACLDSPPNLIYLPEGDFSLDKFLADIKNLHDNGIKSVTVAVSEGIDLGDSYRDKRYCDAFGHLQNAGVGKYLSDAVADNLGCKTRAVELNIMQRCAGHLQSEIDVYEANRVGEYAVKSALNGETAIMTAIKRTANLPYQSEIISVPVTQVGGKVKYFPKDWINPEGNGILPIAKDYFLPLIGELPMHFRF